MDGTRVKVFDLTVDISGPLEGKFNDWPANIQDGIMQAIERKAQEVGLPLVMVDSACSIDYGETKEQDKFYIHVVVSEVVARDDGYEKRLIDSQMRLINMVKETKH